MKRESSNAMRTIKLLIMLVILFTGFSGCVNDRGNYDYDTIPVFLTDDWQVKVNDNNVKVGDDQKIILHNGDRLNITMNSDFSGKSSPEYHWKVFPKKQAENPDNVFETPREIAKTKDFNQTFDEVPGTYTLYFEAMNQDNGTKFCAQFTVEVLSIKGILVYFTDMEGKGDYGAFSTAELFPELPADHLGRTDHIYSTINNGAKIENPTHLWVRKAMKNREAHRKILLASENTITVVNYETHEKESDNYSALFFIPSEKAPKPEGFMTGFQKEFLIQNGELCVIDYMSGGAVFGTHYGKFGCEYSPYMMSIPMDMSTYSGGWNIAFNKTSRGFEIDAWNFMSDFVFEEGAIDISNTGMDLLYVEKGQDYSMHSVMRDDNGILHYVYYKLSQDMEQGYYKASCIADYNLSAHHEISEQSHWAVNARGTNSFFSSGNEIYSLSHKNGNITPADLELPTNAEIVALQVLKDTENAVYDNALLFIAYNVNGEGNVLQYRFNPLSGVINKGSKQGFGEYGRILGIALKK